MAAAGKLKGKVALVTGGASGLGRAIAQALHKEHARVAVADRNGLAMSETVTELNGRLKTPSRLASSFFCDVADQAAVESMISAVESAFGTNVDILVNCAGIGHSGKIAETDAIAWNRTIAVNLTGSFHVTRAVLPRMLENGYGRVVNISSIAGVRGLPFATAYSASKHGVVGFTRAAALELHGTGVSICAVCPGFSETPMTDDSVETIVRKTGMKAQDAKKLLARQNKNKRLIKPERVAKEVLKRASSIRSNGMVIVIE